MRVFAYERFRKSYQHLPRQIQLKVDKQVALLVDNSHHPSLQVKRIKGAGALWEARMVKRFTSGSSAIMMRFCRARKAFAHP